MNSIPSKIKSIYLELPDYTFNHSALDGNKKYYVGRHQSYRRLKMILLNSANCESGTYLVAGYRGMGKTSLVNHVITDINKPEQDPKDKTNNSGETGHPDIEHRSSEKEEKAEKIYLPGPKLWPISISLSQDDVKDIDVLKLMANQLAQEWFHFKEKLIPMGLTDEESELYKDISQRLQKLSDNLNSIVKIQTGNNYRRTLQESRLGRREVIRHEFLPKEVERELQHILNLISEFRKREILALPQFIFILDELDKIEPNYFYENDYKGKSNPQEEQDNVFGANKIRKRQEVISRLLANLKSFLNTAKAKFIFIGGREMYDASLADIADRDSFYSSIFHDIIYVNSFFKDRISSAQTGLTRLTEAFLCKIIIPNSFIKELQKKELTEDDADDERLYHLNSYFKYLVNRLLKNNAKYIDDKHNDFFNLDEATKSQAIYKVVFFLQNFIIYLAFRSNGTPKKLVAMTESYMVSKTSKEVANKVRNPQQIWITHDTKRDEDDTKDRIFLYFSFKKQYEIGLTSNIYRPYIIIHSRYLKTLGDKLLYSTSYIMDYLLKFHPHAFSWRNLELIPEIILLNKDPNLRYFISDILNFLSGMYIRETTSGMFQYKFYNKPSNEIKLLTKISESASAAFNFTLDESLHIIRYYRRKLHYLKQMYPNYQNEYIHSIGFIESMLGDLYYLDKEYDEAVVHYTNAIQTLRSMVQRKPEHLTKHQVVLYVKDKLHLGLCLEKMKAYDSAYSIYRSLILNVPILLEKVMHYSFTEEEFKGVLQENLHQDEWDKPIRRVQLFIKPHIALLDLIEKQRLDGITYANLARNHSEVYKFLVDVKTSVPQHVTTITIGKGINQKEIQSKVKMDTLRVAVLLSDYFSNVGSFLFFKNKNFPELHELLKEMSLTGERTKNLYQFIQDRKGNGEYHPSLSGFTYYYISLHKLIESYEPAISAIDSLDKASEDQQKIKKNSIQFANTLLSEEYRGVVSNSILVTFGNILTRMGDALFGCLSEKSLHKRKLRIKTLELFSDERFNELQSNQHDLIVNQIAQLLDDRDGSTCTLDYLCDINSVLILYRMAGLFYLRASRTYSYAFQYKKLLFVLKDYLTCFRKAHGQDIKTQDFIDLPNAKFTDEKTVAKLVKETCEEAAKRIFNANTWLNQVANRPQILKYQDMLRPEKESLSDENLRMIYLNLSTNAELRETIVLCEEIKLKLTTMLNLEVKGKDIADPVNPYDLASNRFSRLQELRFQSEVNYYKLMDGRLHEILKSPVLWNLEMLGYFKGINFEQGIENVRNEIWQYRSEIEQLDFTQFKKNKGSSSNLNLGDLREIVIDRVQNKQRTTGIKDEEGLAEIFPELFLNQATIKLILDEKIRTLIQDSIFALFEVIKTHKLFGISYMASHSFLANVHFKLANWCAISLNHDLILKLSSDDNCDRNLLLSFLLKRTLGEEEIHYLRPNYHNELAIQHYTATLNTHNGGNTYKSINQSMSFLEDDFNDNMYHFSAASERFRIHTGLVNSKLADLKRKLKYSNVYDYGHYVKGGGIEWG